MPLTIGFCNRVERLAGRDLKVDAIATRLGCSVEDVREALRLYSLPLPDEHQAAVQAPPREPTAPDWRKHYGKGEA